MDENCNVNVKYQAQWNECYVSVDGVVHCFHCAITEAGIFELYLDDKCIVQEKYMYVKLKGFDFTVEINGEAIHCVFDEKALDVAIQGKYLKKQRNYIPLKAVYIICVVLCALTPVLFFMALTRKMDIVVLIICLIIMGSVRIYYNIGNKSTGKKGK